MGESNIINHAGNVNTFSDTHMVMVGRPTTQLISHSGVDRDIVMIEVGSLTVQSAHSKIGADFDKMGLISMDGLFTPYIINIDGSGHDYLPHWDIPTESGDINSIKMNPFNPNNIFSSGIGLFNESVFFESGHNIAFQNTLREVGVGATGDLSTYKDIGKGSVTPNSGIFDSIRSMGFKAPVILTGWGYNTDGQPVPASSGDPDVFASGAFRDPTLWKTGPLDVRWDDERKVWGSPPTKLFLVKMTNQYNPSCFSFEVDRATTRAQYTRNAPSGERTFNSTGVIYDPESVAYNANALNIGCYEQLDYTDIEFPYYEAFIIRKTNEDSSVSEADYNIWYEDCNDCGHITNECTSMTKHGSVSTKKKILIENPLRQSFETGDLAFTVDTGKKKRVSGSTFNGGSGVGASGYFTINSGGSLSYAQSVAGSGYTSGAFAVYRQPCVGLTLTATSGTITGGTISGTTTGYATTGIFPVTIYPKNASADYEMLPIHWVLQAEFKAKQFVTHVECDNGILQTCSIKGQLQGFSSCEHCGENTALINSFI
jgi:hypothetical protein